jgi:hygromycin-B 7''-O-kinase
MTLPPPPAFSSVASYGSGLGDSTLWEPYVLEVLRRHRLPGGEGNVSGQPPGQVAGARLESVFVGTFPTFLVDGLVVKLFGHFQGWRSSYETELAMNQLLLDYPLIPAPALIAHGQLYDDAEPWPYVVTARLRGCAWRDRQLSAPVGRRLAARIGEVVRCVHELPVPDTPVFSADWMRDNRGGCVARQRAWGTLPPHLVDQIPDYLVDPSPERRLTHADLTEDHLFVDRDELVGVIDWGDASVTDPYYELSALHLGAFGADTTLLRAFLSGFDWPVDDSFTRRAMSAALLHQFDVFAGVAETAQRCTTLDDLARVLWDVR